MNEELEKAKREIWNRLEAGEWLNAAIAAVRLTKLDPDGGESGVLVNSVHKISEIAEKLKKNPKRGAAAKLEKIAKAIPKLNEFASFKELVASAEYIASKKSIVLSVVVGLIFVLVCNVIGYKYLQVQPVNKTQSSVIGGWLGIQKLGKPIDILLLGDSSCMANLAPGAVADRLGGKALNLGNNMGSSLLMDSWMLSDYVEKYGAPKIVVIARTSAGYGVEHNIEFMANTPAPWAYWDDYKAIPEWKNGEIQELFIKKYAVLYSDADVLSERLLKPWDVFSYGIQVRNLSHYYSDNFNLPKEKMDIKTRTPDFYFDEFSYNADTTNAIKSMVSLAQQYHFQLYFTLQAEWDEAVNAGLRSGQITAQKQYLSQFTDPTYVHVVDQVPDTLFTKDQMQNPNHLWHGSDKIYAEEIVNGIVAVQNSLAQKQAKNMELASVSFDKDSYKTGDRPMLTLNVTDPPGDEALTTLNGGVSCLIKPAGDIDAHWVARAPAKSITLKGDEIKEITLQLTAGALTPGTYDLVVFLRQDVGGLSHETRIEMLNKIIVK